MQATTIGLDIAKYVFQVHGVDAAGAVVIHKRIGEAWEARTGGLSPKDYLRLSSMTRCWPSQ